MIQYEIIQDLLPVGLNRPGPGKLLDPEGVIVHETATPGATARNESRYFRGGDRNASAHFFVDDKEIIQLIPENERAWHAGKTANSRFLSVELCHFEDEARFNETWKRGVWLVTSRCLIYGWNPRETVHSHKWVSETWHETDHADPDSYFAKFGFTFDDFIDAVDAVIDIMKGEKDMARLIDIPNEAWKIKLGVDALNNLAAKGIITEPDDHIKVLKESEQNSLDWLSFVCMDRIADKLGIKKTD